VTELVLASVRQPGDAEPFNLHLRDGSVSGISTGDLPAGVKAVDLDGCYVIPGLWDEHVLMTQWALHSNRPDLSSATTAREAAGVVGDPWHPEETITGAMPVAATLPAGRFTFDAGLA
jgi:predicted amidohydrolase